VLEMPDEKALTGININELNRKKLYSPGIIVAYTILANLPIGLVLYGINIINRGFRTYGKIILWSGIICGIVLAAIILHGDPPRILMLINVMCGITIYKYESGPYKKAIAAGALKARWWPPLLIVVAVTVAFYSYMLLFPS
jgi:hypothetical protein